MTSGQSKSVRHSDPASSLLFSDPPLGGFPDSSLRIGVAFEVAGVYESWGFVVDRLTYDRETRTHGVERVAVGRTMKDACDAARAKIQADFAASDAEKCYRCGKGEKAMTHRVDGEDLPLCVDCFARL